MKHMMEMPEETLHWLKKMPDWILEQLHLATDNVHIQNTSQNPITLSLYEWDGKTWAEQQLGDLAKSETMWITLTPLSAVFPWQTRPTGESVLVVRVAKPQEGQSTFWRVDNVHHLWLHTGVYSPRACFSRNAGCKVLGTYHIKPQTYAWHWITPDCLEPIEAHWEYWFDYPVLRKPMP